MHCVFELYKIWVLIFIRKWIKNIWLHLKRSKSLFMGLEKSTEVVWHEVTSNVRVT